MAELPYDPEVLFRVFMDESPLAAWIVDADDRLVYASEPWPLTPDHFGVPMFDLVPEEFAEPYRAALHLARTTGTTQSVTAPAPRPEAGPEAMGWFQGFYFPLPDGHVGGVGLDVTELVAARDEVASSRERLLVASDQVRRRLERDLHDGVQQQLLAQLFKLRLVHRLVLSDPSRARELLSDVIADAQRTIEELRELAHGIHPSVLTQFGLGAALKALVGRTPVRVELDCRIQGRLPDAVEVATYYLCAESLTNIAKYAPAASCKIFLQTRAGSLHVSITDDGPGGAQIREGGGLEGLQDRIEALDGQFALSSTSARGTVVHVSVPLPEGLSYDDPLT
jgi:signal transduction histidine kinase